MRPQVRVSALPVSGRPYNRWGFGLTCARSAARPLAPPYLRLTNFPCRVDHVGGPVVRRSDDVTGSSDRPLQELKGGVIIRGESNHDETKAMDDER
ncbi:hypothetical protein BHE74_00059808 [Ensete ventricosum]|nr:hypothetical protein BHE74_00059808 [Ensete ventricosum]